MGAAGKKLPGHGARRKSNSPPAQPKDGVGNAPHPLHVRSGQRYVARSGSRKRPFQIGRVDLTAGQATARRLDGNRERVQLAVGRLLDTRPDGQGRHYQFLGFDSRRYKTYAVVMAVRTDGHAELVLPEWHPARAVLYPARLLPVRAQRPGAWMTGSADLSKARPAWLNFLPEHDCLPPLPETCRSPTYVASMPPPTPERPTTGRGCGDIVLELVRDVFEQSNMRGGLLDIYVIERPTATRSGDRVYLARGGRITAYLEIRTRELLPNGDFLRCEPALRHLPRPIPSNGRVEECHWRWRWWDRNLEHTASEERIAEIARTTPCGTTPTT